MNILSNASDSTLLALLTALGTGLYAAVRWVFGQFEEHNDRITELERDQLTRDTFDTAILTIYSKMSEGFTHVEVRMDKATERLQERVDKIFESVSTRKD